MNYIPWVYGGVITVRCHYDMVNLPRNPHKMHPIARPLYIYILYWTTLELHLTVQILTYLMYVHVSFHSNLFSPCFRPLAMRGCYHKAWVSSSVWHGPPVFESLSSSHSVWQFVTQGSFSTSTNTWMKTLRGVLRGNIDNIERWSSFPSPGGSDLKRIQHFSNFKRHYADFWLTLLEWCAWCQMQFGFMNQHGFIKFPWCWWTLTSCYQFWTICVIFIEWTYFFTILDEGHKMKQHAI